MARFQPSNKIPAFGLILLILGTMAGGLAVGALLFATSLVTYLIFASPVIAAALGGAVLIAVVRVGKVRNPRVVIVFGLLIGALLYGTYRYLEFLYIVYDYAGQNNGLNESPSVSGFVQVVVDVVKQGGALDTFVKFIQAEADQGITITSSSNYGSSSLDEGTPLSTPVTIGYWVLEILLCLGIPAGMAYNAAKAPFCEDANHWLRYKDIGRVERKTMNDFVQALQARNYQQAAPHLANKRFIRSPYLRVQMARCDEQSEEIYLKIIRIAGRQQRVLGNYTLTPSQYNDLRATGI